MKSCVKTITVLCLVFLIHPVLKSQWHPNCEAGDGFVVQFEEYQGDLYTGGLFKNLCGSASHLARWNGSDWEAVGSGINQEVHAMQVIDSWMYVAAYQFGSDSNYLFRTDGTVWSGL